jgi:serine/threonine protein kinase
MYLQAVNMDQDKQPISTVRKIFGEALALPDQTERDAYLEERCGADAALRSEVDSLIEAFESSNTFLSHNATGEELLDAPDLAGSYIGNYHLIKCIGEGGFGEVYQAEQSGPLKREVALKIIKLGMDTRNVLARFDVERQALARMNHPHIAQVYDAGTTENGRPYFVMELVHGIPMMEYCDRNKLPISDRIHLFRQVCAAVQHAHQKGILHRDLKPSNILVSEENGIPLPKVIDFGVAKSMEKRLSEQTLATLQEMVIGTPLYMSPEQLEPGSSEIDGRSDIYSLGVILYELISGTTPLEHRTPTSMSMTEMRDVLHTKDLPRPSKRFQSLGRKAAVIANRRGIKPPALERLLRGDLDWIIMKAIEMEPVHRYDDVIALSEDLERFLSHRVVSAGPPNPSRRLRKFTRRHKTTSGIVASVSITVLLGAGIMTYSFFKITQIPKSFIEQRGWKLEKFYDMGEVGANAFGLRPDGSVLLVAEWGPVPKGLYWARKGGIWSEDDALSIGEVYTDPEGVIELPEGIYLTDDDSPGKILVIPPEGGEPTLLCDQPIRDPYAILIAPTNFLGPNVNPGDLLVFDNGMGNHRLAAIWSINRTTGNIRPLIMGNPLSDGFLTGGFAPDGTLYTSLNNHEKGAVSILRISAKGEAEVVLRNFYFSEGEDRKSANIAVHPITGEVFFSVQRVIFAFSPGRTSPRHILPKGVLAMQWAPDGSKLYLIADKAIWTLSGPGIASQPVSSAE